MNINDASQIRVCTSCQMCGAVCPTGAITIQLNDTGFYRPVIDSDECIDCGLCVKSCYKFDQSIKQTTDLNSKKIFAAWAKDSGIVETTTSGGIADLLAHELISQGYKCIGVAYDADTDCAVGAVAGSTDELQQFKGSKYIQSLSVDAFKNLVKEQKSQKVAVFGLPCQIYAIDRYLRLRGTRDRHILIDLYCHGCPSLNLWKKYIREILQKVDGKKVLSANFRSKVRGWGNCYVVVVKVGEGVSYPIEVVSSKINDPFYTMFFSDLVLNDSCYDCALRSTLEYTDIRLGDFWGKSYVANHKGVSGVTICSSSGKELFDSIRPEIVVEPQKFENFMPYQSYGKSYGCNTRLRDQLLVELADTSMPLKKVVATYNNSLSLSRKIKNTAKNIVCLMPSGIISSIKAFFYALKK